MVSPLDAQCYNGNSNSNNNKKRTLPGMDHGNGPHQNENNQNRILFRYLLFIYWNWLHRLLVATFEHADLNSNWSHFFWSNELYLKSRKIGAFFPVVGKLFIQPIKIHHMVYWYKFMGSERVQCTALCAKPFFMMSYIKMMRLQWLCIFFVFVCLF